MENTPENKTEEKPKETAKSKWCPRSFDKKTILGIVILLLIIGYAVYAKNPGNFSLGNLFSKSISKDQAKAKVLDYIKANLIQPGTEVTVKDITEENGLYKITVSATGQDVVTYLTKDGTKFFPYPPNDLTQANKPAQNNQQAAAPKDIPKSDTPDVKLFVMSYCPFGTQMEKGILPVVTTLGSKIKYNLEFVDYSMHNDASTGDRKELDENLRQYCIEKNQSTKLNTYLTCFLKKGQGTESSCMASAGVNVAQVTSCMTQTDSQFNVTKDFADKSTWSGGQFPPFDVNKADNVQYGVQGSPTLIINGVEAQSAGRDSASILKTICSAFNNPPKECQTKLSTTAPSSGFGDGTAAAGAAPASCATPPAQ